MPYFHRPDHNLAVKHNWVAHYARHSGGFGGRGANKHTRLAVLGKLLFKVTSYIYILLATELFSYSYILPI